jgi:hypothetical protein
MTSKRTEISNYNTLLEAYNNTRNEWNMGVEIDNVVVNWQLFNFLIPKDDQNRVYTRPSRPYMPYQPSTYIGPTFSDTLPLFGWGKISSYMFDLPTGGTANVYDSSITAFVYEPVYKNFGRIGYDTDNTLSLRET